MFIQCWHCPHVCLWKAPPNIHQWSKDHLQHLQLVKSQELQHVGRIMHESTTCLHVNFKLRVGLLGTEWMYYNSDRSVVQFGHPFLLSLHLGKAGKPSLQGYTLEEALKSQRPGQQNDDFRRPGVDGFNWMSFHVWERRSEVRLKMK